MKSKLGPAITVAAAALFIVLALAACGGGGEGGSGGANSAANEDQQEAALAYARCMREHGVDFPDPVNGRFQFRSEPGDEEKVERAQEACRDLLEDAAPPVDEEQQAEEREAALAFARCMRQHGVDMPDPTFPEGGGSLMRMPEGAQDDPDFEEAKNACQPLLDAAQPDGGSAQGGSS